MISDHLVCRRRGRARPTPLLFPLPCLQSVFSTRYVNSTGGFSHVGGKGNWWLCALGMWRVQRIFLCSVLKESPSESCSCPERLVEKEFGGRSREVLFTKCITVRSVGASFSQSAQMPFFSHKSGPQLVVLNPVYLLSTGTFSESKS